MTTTSGAATGSAQTRAEQRRAVLALVALSVSAFAFVTAENLPGGMLTLIAPDLGRTTSEIGLLVTAYAGVVVVASIPLARLTKGLSRRTALATTTALCAVGTLWSALAVGYWDQMAARVVTALGQALFWAIVVPAAAALFTPEVRGKMIARLTIGNSLAPVLGVPLGTWLGQQAGWRTSFFVLSGVTLVACVAVLVTMPPSGATVSDTTRGTDPSLRRYVTLMVATALLVTGAFGTITFVTQLLLEVTGFPREFLGPLLLCQGMAGVLATFAVGQFLDRRPWHIMTLGACGVVVAMVVLTAGATVPAVVVAGLVLFGFSFAAVPPGISALILRVAPGSTDIASAASSSIFNIGIAAGSALGAAVVAAVGVRAVPLAGAGFIVLALATLAWGLRGPGAAVTGPPAGAPADAPAV